MPILSPLERIEYPESDGKPMAETDWHIKAIFDLRLRLEAWMAKRDDVYVSGNLLVYYREGDPRKSLAPDCFVVFGVPNRERATFKTWEEGAVPSVVFEITSKSTRREDLNKKFKIYRDIWMVNEYFLFDPLGEYLKPSLQGYRRKGKEFVPIRVVHGRVKSERLGMTFEIEEDRLIPKEAATGKRILTLAEAEIAEQKERALREAHRAEKSEARMETAIEREAAAQAEVERLRAELAALKNAKK